MHVYIFLEASQQNSSKHIGSPTENPKGVREHWGKEVFFDLPSLCAAFLFFFRSFCMLSCQKFKFKPLREHCPRNLQFCITCTKKLLRVLFVSHASRFVYSPAWDNHGHGIATFFCHEIFGVGSPALASIFPKVYAKNTCDVTFFSLESTGKILAVPRSIWNSKPSNWGDCGRMCLVKGGVG